ncbi:hypothetical protein KSK37_12160 [Kaistella sp. DKR-2]|uniref:hypothetical protein n=1 Tax=Kaistella soli TaxID=2849654 RepID=UPI001C25551C|nr:hypothetical protein [Kaistella soli]MBU8883840.1 hypothetical protein [Kaistella soli]
MAKKQPDFKETTSLQQFRGAIDFLQTHIQLLDASLIQTSKVLKKTMDKELHINKALLISEDDYNRLNHPVKQQSALIKHSQKKNIEFSIIRLFNLFTAYLQGITKEMYAKNPMLVVGKAVINKNGEDKENLTITYAEIVRLGNYENIQEKIVNNIFRSIEDLRSTNKLLEKILKDTKVNIPTTVTDEALMYLEMRHLFIHNHGKVDTKYANTFGKKFTPHLRDRDALPTKFETFSNALVVITELIIQIDAEMIKNGMVQKKSF